MNTVSVIVPIYNVENYLRRCIDSVVSQTYKDLEIILVNDGSTDNSGIICKDYIERDGRIIYIEQKNSGLSAARNRGIEKSTGKYLYFLDSDDYINKYTIELLMDAAIKNNVPVVVGNYENVYEEKANLDIRTNTQCTVLNREDFFYQKVSNHAWNKLYLKELFNDVRYPVGKNYEDIATTYKIFAKTEKFGYIDFPFYKYYMRVGAISKTFSEKNAADIIWAYEQVKNDSILSSIKIENISYYLLTIIMAINKVLNNLPQECKLFKKQNMAIIRRDFSEYFKNINIFEIKDRKMIIKLILFKLNILNLINR